MSQPKKQPRGKSLQLTLLALTVLACGLVALFFFVDSSPRWDPTGEERFKQWGLASIAGLVLLLLNLGAYFLLRKEGDPATQSRSWPVVYLICGLLLLLPWSYYWMKGATAHDVLVRNQTGRTIQEVQVTGKDYHFRLQQLPPGSFRHLRSIRAPFPRKGMVIWQLAAPRAEGEELAAPEPEQALLPPHPGDPGQVLIIELSLEKTESRWEEARKK